MSDVIIRAENLGKKLQISRGGTPASYATLRDVVTDKLLHPFRRNGRNQKKEDFWALRNASFEVRQGDIVGVIGHNGAGKTTLLKILSRITEPTEGRVRIRGRVASLLEVGTGFHGELTGRENIFLNGAILGMSKAEIRKNFDRIVDFAEVGRFLDTPVKRYSSGMYVRLAFAIAAHLEPEILLVDEVLAVGDVAFQKKCLGKIGEVADQGRTVLFVSHNLGAVRTLCRTGMLLHHGRLEETGNAAEIITAYLSRMDELAQNEGQLFWAENGASPGNDEICLRGIRLLSNSGSPQATFEPDKDIHIEIYYEVKTQLRGVRFNLHVLTQEGEEAFSATDHDFRPEIETPGLYKSMCTIPGGLMNQRLYRFELSCDLPGVRILIPRAPYMQFMVSGAGNQASTFPETWSGVVCPRLDWFIERVARLPAQ